MLMKKNKKKVYLAFSSDIFVGPYFKILKRASKLGSLTVGLLTDNAISKYRTIPPLTYEQRYHQIKKFKFIEKVVPQDEPNYTKNLNLVFSLLGLKRKRKMAMASNLRKMYKY